MALYNRIAAYGIELEGGWEIEPRGAVHDGSVEGLDHVGFEGELPSPPLRSLDSVATWVRQNFYDECNDSCGMHVHMSFKNLADYALLMDGEEFQDHLLQGIREWADNNSHISSYHPIYKRLDGENDMCELNYCPDTQVIQEGKDSSRYNVLNFCYPLHTTLEIRVLPAFEDSYDAIDAINETSRLVNAWLKRNRKRTLKKTQLRLVMSKVHKESETIVLPAAKTYDWESGMADTNVNVSGDITIHNETEIN